MATFRLLGRLLLNGTLRAVTGMHIGGSPAGLNIGGLDNPVIRDPTTRWPYIPGSSLKGKMRSLAERARGFDPDNKEQIQRIGQVRIHVCQEKAAYDRCPVCQVFGLPGELEHSTPTRLTVRDAFLDPDSLEGAQMDFLFTEVKWEASIDRITSAALPRQIERVPARATFKDVELVLSLYDVGRPVEEEFALIRQLFLAMQLLEDDYLGGLGSRGSGKVRFENLELALRKGSARVPFPELTSTDLAGVIEAQDAIVGWAHDTLLRD